MGIDKMMKEISLTHANPCAHTHEKLFTWIELLAAKGS